MLKNWTVVSPRMKKETGESRRLRLKCLSKVKGIRNKDFIKYTLLNFNILTPREEPQARVHVLGPRINPEVWNRYVSKVKEKTNEGSLECRK